MRNIEKLANYVAKNGAQDIIVHIIPSNGHWIIAQKIGENTWSLNLGDPMGFTMYNLGSITNDQHLQLWMEIIKMEIEKKAELIRRQNR